MYISSHKKGFLFQRHLPAFKGTSNADNWTEPDLSFLPAVLTNALFSTSPLVFTPKHFPLWITDITKAHLAARSVDFPPFSLPGFRLEHKSHFRKNILKSQLALQGLSIPNRKKGQVVYLLLCQNRRKQTMISNDIKNIKMIIIFMMKCEETCRCSSSTGRLLLAQETPQHCWQAGQDCILVL